MTYEQAKQELIRAGYKVSSGSWKDHDSDWFVFSQEGAGPDTYGSPMARIRNDNGRITKDIPKHPGTNYKWSASLRDRIALAAVKRELADDDRFVVYWEDEDGVDHKYIVTDTIEEAREEVKEARREHNGSDVTIWDMLTKKWVK
jgi:predicted RNase H-like HicB family nuclease